MKADSCRPRARRLAFPLPAQGRMTPLDSARHVLNRLAYGATPGEIDAVAREGVLHWVDSPARLHRPARSGTGGGRA